MTIILFAWRGHQLQFVRAASFMDRCFCCFNVHVTIGCSGCVSVKLEKVITFHIWIPNWFLPHSFPTVEKTMKERKLELLTIPTSIANMTIWCYCSNLQPLLTIIMHKNCINTVRVRSICKQMDAREHIWKHYSPSMWMKYKLFTARTPLFCFQQFNHGNVKYIKLITCTVGKALACTYT